MNHTYTVRIAGRIHRLGRNLQRNIRGNARKASLSGGRGFTQRSAAHQGGMQVQTEGFFRIFRNTRQAFDQLIQIVAQTLPHILHSAFPFFTCAYFIEIREIKIHHALAVFFGIAHIIQDAAAQAARCISDSVVIRQPVDMLCHMRDDFTGLTDSFLFRYIRLIQSLFQRHLGRHPFDLQNIQPAANLHGMASFIKCHGIRKDLLTQAGSQTMRLFHSFFLADHYLFQNHFMVQPKDIEHAGMHSLCHGNSR